MNGFVVLLIIICILCYVGQIFFNKLFSANYSGSAAAAAPVFNTIYSVIIVVITFSLNHFAVDASPATILMGAANGFIIFMYNLGMIQAARRGPYAFQSIVMLFASIVVLMFFSCIFWGDSLSTLQLVGVLVMLASFVFLNMGGLKYSNIKKGYYVWVIVVFFTNGFYGVFMDAQQRNYPAERNEMIIMTFLSCAVISVIYLLTSQRGHIKEAFTMSRKTAAFAVISSASAGFAIYILMILLAYVPGYILFTINNGSIMVLNVILCRIVLKEEMTKMSLVGIILAVISIVTLSI